MGIHQVFDLPKGFLKSFNDFNQDAKTIYDKYFLYPDGVVISDNSYKYMIGSHYCKTEFSFSKINERFNSLVLELDSDAIYRGIKDNKKYIQYIRIDTDNCIYLMGTNELYINIGYWHNYYATETECPKLRKLVNNYRDANKCIRENLPNTIMISEEHVEDLVKNQYKNYSLNHYSTRITREIIPGLKKSHELSISFYENTNDDRLFNIRLTDNRASLTSYHNYTCIFM